MHLPYDQLPDAERYTGNYTNGEIEILPGLSNAVSVVLQNKYITVLEDHVRFPSGKEGSYLRILHQSELSGDHGTVMVTAKDGQYVLLRHFRHATRSWEVEFPRGFAAPGLSVEENARREVREELDVDCARIDRIGVVCPNTSLLACRAWVLRVELDTLPSSALGEYQVHEATQSLAILNRTALIAMIRAGEIRCGFTLAAFMITEALTV